MLRTARRGMRVFVDASETHGVFAVAAVLVKVTRMLFDRGKYTQRQENITRLR